MEDYVKTLHCEVGFQYQFFSVNDINDYLCTQIYSSKKSKNQWLSELKKTQWAKYKYL